MSLLVPRHTVIPLPSICRAVIFLNHSDFFFLKRTDYETQMQSEATLEHPVWGGCLLLPNVMSFSLEESLEQGSQGHQVRCKIEKTAKKLRKRSHLCGVISLLPIWEN